MEEYYDPMEFTGSEEYWDIGSVPGGGYDPTPWYESAWETTKETISALSGFGLKAYTAYQSGKKQVADSQALTYQLPASQPAEKQAYVIQAGTPAPAQASRVIMAGTGTTGGINTNMILIGAAILGAAFMMQGK